jgi:hypothetical protein
MRCFVFGVVAVAGAPDVDAVMDRLAPVLDKLKNLDPKAFGSLEHMVGGVEHQEEKNSFLQRHDVDPSDVMDRLAPVLEKLKGLDPKAFGALNNMMDKAETTSGKSADSYSFMQYVKEDPEDVEEKMEKLGPILEKLKGLNPNMFGGVANAAELVAKKASQEDSFLQGPTISDPCSTVKCGNLVCPTGFLIENVKGHCCPYCTNPNIKVGKKITGPTGSHGGKASVTCPDVFCFPTLCSTDTTAPTTTNGLCCPTCPK